MSLLEELQKITMITFVPGNGVARKMQKPEFLTKISEFFCNSEFFWDLSFFESVQKKACIKAGFFVRF